METISKDNFYGHLVKVRAGIGNWVSFLSESFLPPPILCFHDFFSFAKNKPPEEESKTRSIHIAAFLIGPDEKAK